MKHQSACKFCHEIFEETDDYDSHFADCSPEIAAEEHKKNPGHGVSEWELPAEIKLEEDSILTPIQEPATINESDGGEAA
jgi:hypothetical protein